MIARVSLILAVVGVCSMGSPSTDLPLTLTNEHVTGDAVLQGIVDAEEGGVCTLWHLPADKNGAEMSFDLNGLGILPNDYDEIQIEFRTKKSVVLFMPRLSAYPVNDLCRNWYSKIEMVPGQWTVARFDLRLDDDGCFMPKDPSNAPCLTVKVGKRWLRMPGEVQTRDIEIRRISFVKHPVLVDFEPTDALFLRDGDRLIWQYVLQVRNSMVQSRKVTLALGSDDLDLFEPSWRTRELTLAPRQRVEIPLVFTASARDAYSRPPLYSERASVIVRHDEMGVPSMTPLYGYRPKFLWATVPPARLDWRPDVPDSDKREKTIDRARQALRERWGVPIHGPSGHPQSYIDSKTNQNPEALSWFRHVAKDGTIIEDAKISTAYIGLIHADNFKRAGLLGQAYELTHDLIFAEAARDVFLEYCKWYLYLPVSGPASTSGRTRLHQSSLQTCFWFAAAIDAYARIKDSPALGEADKEEIETAFFKPELAAIYTHNIEFSNMQVHHFETYTHAVVALDRFWNLVGEALHGTHGFYSMIEQAFTADGLAHEAGVYHWFTLGPMMEFVEKMDSFGIDVMNERFKRVFDGTLANTPDGVIPTTALGHFYPRAYRSYRDPAYIPTLQRFGHWPPTWLDAESAQREAAKAPGPLTTNTLQPSNGYLWLREASEKGFRALSINYIMQLDRGEHDRLHVALFDPDRLTSEVFRITYGSPQAKLMYRTFAHNTVVIDRGDQLDLPSKLAAFLDRPSLPAALITESPASNIWPGAEFARCVALVDGFFFVGDLCHMPGEHDFDWPFYGCWEPWVAADVGLVHPSVATEDPVETGYPFVAEARKGETDAAFSGWCNVPEFKAGSLRPASGAKPYKRLHFAFAPVPAAQIIAGELPRGHRPQPGPFFMVRQSARETARFGVAFDVTGLEEESRIANVEVVPVTTIGGEAVQPSQAAAWVITGDNGQYGIVINRTGGPVKAGPLQATSVLTVEKLAAK